MSVKVTYQSQPSPPPTGISAGTTGDNWNGNTVVFSHVGVSEFVSLPCLQVQTRRHDDQSGRGCLAHLHAQDARDLAAALVEWADAVEG